MPTADYVIKVRGRLIEIIIDLSTKYRYPPAWIPVGTFRPLLIYFPF